MDALLTVPEAAGSLKVSPSTVWRWIDAGKLPAVRIGSRKIRVRAEDLQAMVRPARHAARPSEEQLRRRREAAERILARRKELVITPFTSLDLLDAVRQRRDTTADYGQLRHR